MQIRKLNLPLNLMPNISGDLCRLRQSISNDMCDLHKTTCQRVSLFDPWWFCSAQVMTQRIIGSPRKRDQEDLHLQSCGALSSSSSPSMCRPKHLPQTTSASTKPQDSPSSEQSLEYRETILWPFSQQGLGSKLWGHFMVLEMQTRRAVQQMSVESLTTLQTVWDHLFVQCGRSIGKLKCSHAVSPSALWDRAKSSAETVANSV